MLFRTTALLAFAASASAHLVMDSPVPFAYEDEATKQAPLETADFPCKQPAGTYAVQSMNTVAAGDSLNFHLTGGATHGGGSCQFSITTDTKPTKESQWKVIHSQIHGCTGGPDDDNMSDSSTDSRNPNIPIKIPDGLPAGQYTFAWTWLNKMGNREFYMNCAPLTVTSGSSKRDTASTSAASILGQLPDMFVANVPSNSAECKVEADQDYVYPNPGDSVATGEGAVPGTAITGNNCAAITVMGKGAGKLGSPAQATGGSGYATGAASQPAASATPTVVAPDSGSEGGVYAPGASSGSAPAASAPAVTQAPVASQPAASQPAVSEAPVASQPAASQPAAAQPSSPSTGGYETGSGSGSGNTSSGTCTGTPCTNEGGVVCIGTDSYGLCNFGCAVAQQLAAGMTCSNGAVSRRSIKFPRGVYHNRHAALHKRVSVL